jgi:carboxymethylenebutenolidase
MPFFQQLEAIETADGPMGAYMAFPEGPGPFPAAIVIAGQPGPSTPEFSHAERLAQNGYVGIAPNLFHRGPFIHNLEEREKRRRALTDDETISDMNAVIDHLQSLPFVRKDSIAICGFCLGGRVAFMMATLRPDLAAAIDAYGGGIFQGYGRPAPAEATADIKAPVLILNGDSDQVVSVDEINRVSAELTKHGKVHEVHLYPGIGHGFMSARGSKEIIDESWDRIFVWFDKYMPARQAEAVKA